MTRYRSFLAKLLNEFGVFPPSHLSPLNVKVVSRKHLQKSFADFKDVFGFKILGTKLSFHSSHIFKKILSFLFLKFLNHTEFYSKLLSPFFKDRSSGWHIFFPDTVLTISKHILLRPEIHNLLIFYCFHVLSTFTFF